MGCGSTWSWWKLASLMWKNRARLWVVSATYTCVPRTGWLECTEWTNAPVSDTCPSPPPTVHWLQLSIGIHPSDSFVGYECRVWICGAPRHPSLVSRCQGRVVQKSGCWKLLLGLGAHKVHRVEGWCRPVIIIHHPKGCHCTIGSSWAGRAIRRPGPA